MIQQSDVLGDFIIIYALGVLLKNVFGILVSFYIFDEWKNSMNNVGTIAVWAFDVLLFDWTKGREPIADGQLSPQLMTSREHCHSSFFQVNLVSPGSRQSAGSRYWQWDP